jgi:hypothetical protein
MSETEISERVLDALTKFLRMLSDFRDPLRNYPGTLRLIM